MSEQIIVRQTSDFAAKIFATHPQHPESSDFAPVETVSDLTPFGMLLVSLGTCTTILLHSYAQQHEVDLDEAGLHLWYEEVEAPGDKYKEQIRSKVLFNGDLTEDERAKLFKISRQCAIHHLLEKGVLIGTQQAESLPG